MELLIIDAHIVVSSSHFLSAFKQTLVLLLQFIRSNICISGNSIV